MTQTAFSEKPWAAFLPIGRLGELGSHLWVGEGVGLVYSILCSWFNDPPLG